MTHDTVSICIIIRTMIAVPGRVPQLYFHCKVVYFRSSCTSHRLARGANRRGPTTNMPHCKLICHKVIENQMVLSKKSLSAACALSDPGRDFCRFCKKNRPTNPKFQNRPLKKSRSHIKSADFTGPEKWSWNAQCPTTL